MRFMSLRVKPRSASFSTCLNSLYPKRPVCSGSACSKRQHQHDHRGEEGGIEKLDLTATTKHIFHNALVSHYKHCLVQHNSLAGRHQIFNSHAFLLSKPTASTCLNASSILCSISSLGKPWSRYASASSCTVIAYCRAR